MAKIPVEKETGGAGWWKWLLGLLVLGALIWLVIEIINPDDAEIATEPVPEEQITEETTPEPVAPAEGVTIGDILGNPDDYVGETYPGAEVTVATDREMTDRGFWIQDEGRHLFAVLVDQPQEQPVDVNPGATLRITEGTLRQPDFLADLPGAPLDQTTESIAREQEIFVVVNENDISVLEQGNPQPGTDPAQDIQ